MQVSLTPREGSDRSVVVTGDGIGGHALWRGEVAPAYSAQIDVELEVPGQVDWARIIVMGETTGLPAVADDELLVQGVVEDIDQDGVATLRLGNSVALIDTTGEPPLHVVGASVALVVRSAAIYPTGV